MVKETDLKPEAIGLIISLLLITWVPADVAAGDGDAVAVDSLIVQWAGGGVQVLTDVNANQYLTITETATSK